MIESALGNLITLILCAGLLLLAAGSDAISHKIPNKVVVAILAIYPLHVLVSPVTVDWLGGLEVFGIALAIGFALFATIKFGAGDAKLMAAVMLWAGPGLALPTVFVFSILGGIQGLIMLTPIRFVIANALSSAGRQDASEAILTRQMPYGVPIALSGIFVCWGLFVSSGLNG